ncbi:S1C family serine protease [Nocardia spumae]|uniref:S1C family serine protease n=1 Tax=Nocardia spumae TaxID=2887190 RepID=UPI001D1361B5|nr:trypsin-like peptidase domain-containing protein [Nocardia spumae]
MDEQQQGPAPRPARGGWPSVVAFAIVMALVGTVFLGYRGDLPRWAVPSGYTSSTLFGPPLPPMDPAVVAAAVEPELVNINVAIRPSGMGAAGSGIVLSPDGEILTSHHVVKGAETISVGDIGNGAHYPATVLGYDSEEDIALLSLTGAGALPVARIGSSAGVRVGDQVVAIGNAGGTGRPTATPGTVTALDSSIVARDAADLSRKALIGMIEVAAPVVSGQSGGALADRSGAVIGVVTAASGELARSEGKASGYAVPIDRALTVVRQIRTGVPTDTVHIGPTATLGVLTSDATPAGARVDVAIYGLPAFAAGMNSGEVIVAVDGRPVGSAQMLKSALNVRHPADSVVLELVEPDGTHRTLSVTLAAGPPN